MYSIFFFNVKGFVLMHTVGKSGPKTSVFDCCVQIKQHMLTAATVSNTQTCRSYTTRLSETIHKG